MTNIILLKMGTVLCFSYDDFKITGNMAVHNCGITCIDIRTYAYICQLFSRIESLCKSMFIISPMQYEANFTKNINCWYMLEPPL